MTIRWTRIYPGYYRGEAMLDMERDGSTYARKVAIYIRRFDEWKFSGPWAFEISGIEPDGAETWTLIRYGDTPTPSKREAVAGILATLKAGIRCTRDGWCVRDQCQAKP